jgi:hypothetical protein
VQHSFLGLWTGMYFVSLMNIAMAVAVQFASQPVLDIMKPS